MIIGEFTYDAKANVYSGQIVTLMLEFYGVQFRPVDKSSDEEPDYRVVYQTPHDNVVELGAAWARTSKKGQRFLSVMIDDPGLVSPLNMALFPSEDGKAAQLVWNRPKAKAKADASTKKAA